MTQGPGGRESVESLIRVELDRVVGQCQRLGERGLTEELQLTVRSAAQAIADAVAEVEGVPVRQLPVVRPLAVVHQLQVVAADALLLDDSALVKKVADVVGGLRRELSAAVTARSRH